MITLIATTSYSDFLSNVLAELITGGFATVLLFASGGLVRWREVAKRDTLRKLFNYRTLLIISAILLCSYGVWYYRLPDYHKAQHQDYLRFKRAWVFSGFQTLSPFDQALVLPENINGIVYKGIPASQERVDVLFMNNMAIGYDSTLQSPRWVAYSIEGNQVTVPTTYGFHPDHRINFPDPFSINGSTDQYILTPLADPSLLGAFKGREAYEDCLLTSNLSLMPNELIDGHWNRINQGIQRFSKRFNKLYVYIIPHFLDVPETVATVAAPDGFYIAMVGTLDDNRIVTQSIHLRGDQPVVVSIDSIEAATKLDLYPNMPTTVFEELTPSMARELSGF